MESSPTNTSSLPPLPPPSLPPSPPLDFSFHELASFADLPTHEPNNYKLNKDKKNNNNNNNNNAEVKKSAKQNLSGVRLSYNNLTSLKGLSIALSHFLLDPSLITWLDLSHNKLSVIDEDIATLFPHLKTLYLHGNAISSIVEIRKLNSCLNLQKLTVHGCPIYHDKFNHHLSHPRSAIIWSIRGTQLRSLDFATLTDQDRRHAIRWSETQAKKKKRRDDAGEKKNY